MGYGEAKQALFEATWAYFADARERRAQWESRPEALEDVLQAGAAKARAKGREVLNRVREACGLRPVAVPAR
jgi:tryptophanyl-tRNA synthetase